MTATSPIRFGLIGAGGIAQAYASAFRGHPDASLVAVTDVRSSAAEAVAGTVDGCRAFPTPAALLESAGCDAVVIATPPNTHEELAVQCLDAGCHVLCEKPFTIGVRSARRMIAAAERNSRVLTMASKFRYTRDIIQAKQMVQTGLIGDVILFENAFTARVDMSRRWNSDPAVSGGGVLIDNGAHSLDIARYFLGPIHEIKAIEGRRLQPLAVEDTIQVFLRAGAGQMGLIDLSWSIQKERESFVDLYGERGTIRVGWKGSWVKLTHEKEWTRFGDGYDKVGAFRENIGNFARHLRDGEPLIITAADALANVAAIDTGYKSLRKHQWAKTAEPVPV